MGAHVNTRTTTINRHSHPCTAHKKVRLQHTQQTRTTMKGSRKTNKKHGEKRRVEISPKNQALRALLKTSK